MPIAIDNGLRPANLLPHLTRLFDLSAQKILSLAQSWNPEQGTPVVTRQGQYTSRHWTEWTAGFQFGSALLQFDATGDERFLEIGRAGTVQHMATHVSHVGVHDHGFNNVSTYGHLLRLMREGRLPADPGETHFYELALKASGAVQAARWTPIDERSGFIHSFNGPHSLFIDTMRSLRSLALAHGLGHVLMGERDVRISLLGRLLQHASATAQFNVYYGEERDIYDRRGRTAQECVFNLNDGAFRCPNSQQGYSPYSTWTRGLAWGVLGFAEQLEFLARIPEPELKQAGATSASAIEEIFLKAALAEADFYLEHACADGMVIWDTSAPGLRELGDYTLRPSDPYNEWEPVDSSAAAIAAQGLLRLGNYLAGKGQSELAQRYRHASYTIVNTLFQEPYLSLDPQHQGLLLHSVYHRPAGWDYLPHGQRVPNGESSMWGDYHARELALLLWREARCEPYPAFYNCLVPA